MHQHIGMVQGCRLPRAAWAMGKGCLGAVTGLIGLLSASAQTYLQPLPYQVGARENQHEVTVTWVRRNLTEEDFYRTQTYYFWTTNGSALAGRDYEVIQGTLVFGPGEDQASARITILDNTTLDDDRNFWVVVPNAYFSYAQWTSVIIADNENPGSGDPGFRFESDSRFYYTWILAMAVQPDNKVVLGGYGYDLNTGAPTPVIMRILPDGRLEWSRDLVHENFYPTETAVRAVALQSDGKIVFGGQFTKVEGYSRTNLARLNPDGSVDVDYAPGVQSVVSGPGDGIEELVVTSEGKVVAGGHYLVAAGGTVRSNLVRFEATGAVDEGFAAVTLGFGPGTGPLVSGLALDENGNLLVAGRFDAINGLARPGLARLLTDGMVDPMFHPDIITPEGTFAVAVQGSRGILISGLFTSIDGVPLSKLARLHSDGSLDESFLVEPDAYQQQFGVLLPQSDGKILVGHWSDETHFGLVRLLPDGAVDSGFLTRLFGSYVNTACLGIQGDGRILVGGAIYLGDYFGALRLNGDSVLVPNVEWVGRETGVREGTGTGTVGVVRNGPAGSAVNVPFAVTGGTATLGGDYGISSGVLSFAEGQTYQTLEMPLLDDGEVENAETIELTLGEATPGEVVVNASPMTVRIEDNESPVVLDKSFHPGFGLDDRVRSMALQPDGKLLVAGDFNHASGIRRDEVARYLPDGTLDLTFDPGPTLRGRFGLGGLAVALQADGKVLVGGDFYDTNENRRALLVRFNADGSVDEDFQAFATTSYRVRSIIPLTSGQILVGGGFYLSNNIPANVVRLNADGSLDGSFVVTPGYIDREVRGMALQPDGKILLAGYFRLVGDVPRAHVARLNADGSLDMSFDPGRGANKDCAAVLVQPDGKILLVGDFTAYQGVADWRIARLNTDGTRDPTFQPTLGANHEIHTVGIQADGKIVIGGEFTEVNGVTRSRVARLNSDGSLDLGFNPGQGLNDEVRALAVSPDGIYIGGDFRWFNGVEVNRLARLYPGPGPAQELSLTLQRLYPWENDGGLAMTVRRNGPSTGAVSVPYHTVLGTAGAEDLTPQSGTLNLAPLETEKVIVVPILDDGWVEDDETFTLQLGVPGGGAALGIHPQTAVTIRDNEIAAALDPEFQTPDFVQDPSPSGTFQALALQPDGKLLLAGLVNLGSQGCCFPMVRLNPDGSRDTNFLGSGIYGGLSYAVLPQPDGKILLAGNLGGQNVVRLQTNGLRDNSFISASFDAEVRVLSLLPDNGILVGGDFTLVNGVTHRRIIRLLADGNLDATFKPGSGPNEVVLDIEPQPDGKFLLAGRFTRYNGTNRLYVARIEANGGLDLSFNAAPNDRVRALALLPNGQMIIVGRFTAVSGAPRLYVAKLNSNGALDPTWVPAPANEEVRSVALTADGRIVIAGEFTSVGGVSRNRIARLNADGSLDSTFHPGTGLGGTVWAVLVQPDGKIVAGGEPWWNGTRNVLSLARYNSDTVNLTLLRFAPGAHALGEEAGSLTLAIERIGQVQSALAVGYDAIGGTAQVGLDFPAQPGMVTLPSLQTNGTIQVSVLDDLLAEPEETFGVALQSATAQVPAPATVTILDDDRPGSVDREFQSPWFSYSHFNIVLHALPGNQTLVANASATVPNALVRLNPDGSIDPTFQTPLITTFSIMAIAHQADGKILIGGSFSQVGNELRRGLARLNADGSLDMDFLDAGLAVTNPQSALFVSSLTVQSDGRILLAGAFDSVQGTNRQLVARLHPNGSLDLDFEFNAEVCDVIAPPSHMFQLSDGRILMRGTVSTNQLCASAMLRLLPNGAVDPAYLISPIYDYVLDYDVYPNGQAVLGGSIHEVGGQPAYSVTRLTAEGAVDASFQPSVAGVVAAVAVQPDGKVVIAGPLGLVDGVPRGSITRLHSNGRLDTSFDVARPDINSINAMVLQSDGGIVISHCVVGVGGNTCEIISRLQGDPPLLILDAFRQEDGPFVLYLNTLPSNTYELERSLDLANWDFVAKRIANTNLLEWIDSTATGQPQRFYRALRVAP